MEVVLAVAEAVLRLSKMNTSVAAAKIIAMMTIMPAFTRSWTVSALAVVDVGLEVVAPGK